MGIFRKVESVGKFMKMMEQAQKITCYSHELERHITVRNIPILALDDLILEDLGHTSYSLEFDAVNEVMMKLCEHYGICYYADDRENFFAHRGIAKAVAEGKKYVLMEDLS